MSAPKMKVKPTTFSHEAAKNDLMRAVSRVTSRFPDLTALDVIAILGRMGGYAVGACHPVERQQAYECLEQNIVHGINAIASAAPGGIPGLDGVVVRQ